MQFMLSGVFGGCESYIGADDKEYYRCLILQGVQSYTFGISKELFDMFGKFKLYSPVLCTVQMAIKNHFPVL